MGKGTDLLTNFEKRQPQLNYFKIFKLQNILNNQLNSIKGCHLCLYETIFLYLCLFLGECNKGYSIKTYFDYFNAILCIYTWKEDTQNLIGLNAFPKLCI